MPRKKPTYPRLTEREEEIMKQLWSVGPMTVRELVQTYPEPRPHVNTVSTTVRILEEKGYVAHDDEAAPFHYYAVAEASQFARPGLSNIIQTYFNNSYKSVVSAFVEDEKLTVDELREIIDIIEQQKRQ